jgi:hypothetical protein
MRKRPRTLIAVLERRPVDGPNRNGDVFPCGTWCCTGMRPPTWGEHVQLFFRGIFRRLFGRRKNIGSIETRHQTAYPVGVTITDEQYRQLTETVPLSLGWHIDKSFQGKPADRTAILREAALVVPQPEDNATV